MLAERQRGRISSDRVGEENGLSVQESACQQGCALRRSCRRRVSGSRSVAARVRLVIGVERAGRLRGHQGRADSRRSPADLGLSAAPFRIVRCAAIPALSPSSASAAEQFSLVGCPMQRRFRVLRVGRGQLGLSSTRLSLRSSVDLSGPRYARGHDAARSLHVHLAVPGRPATARRVAVRRAATSGRCICRARHACPCRRWELYRCSAACLFADQRGTTTRATSECRVRQLDSDLRLRQPGCLRAQLRHVQLDSAARSGVRSAAYRFSVRRRASRSNSVGGGDSAAVSLKVWTAARRRLRSAATRRSSRRR